MSLAEDPWVSVIVPVRDDAAGLRRCLRGLGKQTLGHERFEVIVVDNGSETDPADVVRQWAFARLVYENRPGSYAARNAGVRAARAEVLAFTDADCVPAPDWLEKGVAALREDPQVGLLGGRIAVHPVDPSKLTMVELYELRHAFPQDRYARQDGFAATANAFTTRRVLDETGGFLADIASGGDREWGQRVRAAGYRIDYAPDAIVGHPARRTWAEYLHKAERVRNGVVALQRRGLLDNGSQRSGDWQHRLPPVRTWIRALRDPGLTASQRIQYCIAVTVVRYSWLVLRGRRLAGALQASVRRRA